MSDIENFLDQSNQSIIIVLKTILKFAELRLIYFYHNMHMSVSLLFLDKISIYILIKSCYFLKWIRKLKICKNKSYIRIKSKLSIFKI